MTNGPVLSIDGTFHKRDPAERIPQDGAGRNRDLVGRIGSSGVNLRLLTPENRRGDEQA